MSKGKTVTSSSVSQYFSKNLQQVGFSSPMKAVLTTLKEAVDNSLDACEDAGILPEIKVVIEKLGPGTLKNTDKILIRVEDNGPGIPDQYVPQVFGEYLASSKFGRGRCSRGQQGIGISAATTWAQLTNASGAKVITKVKSSKKALSCIVEVDIKNNKGVLKKQEKITWDRPHGTSVEFIIDGRVQLNGDAGLISYLTGTSLVNPHLTLIYQLPESKEVVIERVTKDIPVAPEATEPHPHTMKLGEFITHSHLYQMKTSAWLKTAFSRVNEAALRDLNKHGITKKVLNTQVDKLSDSDIKTLFTTIQDINLLPPSTRSVLSIGEESLAKSIKRLGDVDFFSVVTRKPTICDFKPVQIEVAIARLTKGSPDSPVQVLRFANRVPLQFDKSACAAYQSITSVNWKSYGLNQPRESLPVGPYIIAISVVSPFIKFKNASKETIDGSDELVEEIRLALIQAGQRLSKYIKKEAKAAELEEKIRHIEKFCPILIDTICRITKASATRRKKAEQGLKKILGRDTAEASEALEKADAALERQEKRLGLDD